MRISNRRHSSGPLNKGVLRLGLQHIAAIDRDNAAETGLLQVAPGSAHGAVVAVVAADIHWLGRFDARFGGSTDVDPVQRLEMLKAFKRKSAIQPGRAIQRYLHGFEQEGAATAHWVDQ